MEVLGEKRVIGSDSLALQRSAGTGKHLCQQRDEGSPLHGEQQWVAGTKERFQRNDNYLLEWKFSKQAQGPGRNGSLLDSLDTRHCQWKVQENGFLLCLLDDLNLKMTRGRWHASETYNIIIHIWGVSTSHIDSLHIYTCKIMLK